MQPKNQPQPVKKREPTLKELMAAKRQASESAKTAQKEHSLKEKMARAQQPPPPPKKTGWQGKREDRIKTMIEDDPQKAAELLRKLFLNNK